MLHLALLILVNACKYLDEGSFFNYLTISVLRKVLSRIDQAIKVHSINMCYTPLRIENFDLVSLYLKHYPNPISIPNQIILAELRFLILSCI